jgi:hypothetical protein
MIGKICRTREATDYKHRIYVIGIPDKSGKNTDARSKYVIQYLFLTAVQNIYSSAAVCTEPTVAFQ